MGWYTLPRAGRDVHFFVQSLKSFIGTYNIFKKKTKSRIFEPKLKRMDVPQTSGIYLADKHYFSQPKDITDFKYVNVKKTIYSMVIHIRNKNLKLFTFIVNKTKSNLFIKRMVDYFIKII